MKLNIRFAVVFATQLFCICDYADAATITFDALDSGNYSSTGANTAGNVAYVAGNCAALVCGAGGTYRDFFVFNLAALANLPGIEITDATLVLENTAAGNKNGIFRGGYASPNLSVSGEPGQPADTYVLSSVSTPISALRRGHAAGATGAAIYAGLGTGTQYSSYVLTKSLNDTGSNSVVLIFNQDGVDGLNNALDPQGTSLFAVGGLFQDLIPNNVNQYIFQRSDRNNIRELTVTYTVDAPPQAGAVPEPEAFFLTGFGLLAIGLVRRMPVTALGRR